MKRRLAPIICILLAVGLLFAGCSAPGAAPGQSAAPEQSATPEESAPDETPADETEQPEDDTEGGNASTTGTTPADSYTRYVEAKSVGYDSINAKIEADESLALTAGMALLPVAMVDLYAIPITLLSADEASSEMAAEMLGMSNIDITNDGKTFSITYTDEESAQVTMDGQFDIGTDSLTSNWDMSTGQMTMEYVKYGNGYAGQYYTVNDDGTTSLIKIIVDGEDIAIGLSDTTAQPASIFMSAPADFAFVDDCTTVIKLVGGQGYSLVDGVETAF